MEPLRCKVIVLGDGKVGKTCLLHSYANGLEYLAGRQDYKKTVLENYEMILPINDSDRGLIDPNAVRLSSWDTSGREEFDELRHMCYTTNIPPVDRGGNTTPSNTWGCNGQLSESSQPRCDVSVFILCFAWDDPNSLTGVQMRWYREIRSVEHEVVSVSNVSHCRPFNVLLCGTKFDLRVEADQRGITEGMVTREQAYAVQQSIKADALVVCSSKTGFGVRDVFHTALLLWLQRQAPFTGSPSLMSSSNSISEGSNKPSKHGGRNIFARHCQLL